MRTMGQAKISDVDRLVLQAIVASENQTLYGQKKLQKILFIAHYPAAFDLDVKRALRCLRFQVFRYGPFAQEVYSSLERLELAGLIESEERDTLGGSPELSLPGEEDEGGKPHKLAIFRATPAAAEELSGADEYDRAVVKRTVERWGWLTSDQIESLVCDRTGLTPDLKARFQQAAWDDFERRSKDERGTVSPTIPEDFWRNQQAFLRERISLMRQGLEGQFAAYIAGKRIETGRNDIELYEKVLKERGRAPDFIGFISLAGRQTFDVFAL